MAEGLRLLGACPRCGGELTFAAPAPRRGAARRDDAALAPHLVMGIPRRPDGGEPA